MMEQAKNINDETKSHVVILNKVETDMEKTSLQLRSEALHVETMRQGISGVCWMYTIIIMELILLLLLLYIGISNQ